jgi:hypothetical protein
MLNANGKKNEFNFFYYLSEFLSKIENKKSRHMKWQQTACPTIDAMKTRLRYASQDTTTKHGQREMRGLPTTRNASVFTNPLFQSSRTSLIKRRCSFWK